MYSKVTQEAARLVPFHLHRVAPAAAGMMDCFHVRCEIDWNSGPVQPEAEVEIVDMQKITLVHAAYGMESRSRQHHACAADNRYAGGICRDRVVMMVQPVAAQQPGRQPVKPECFNQGGIRSEQGTPGSALIAPVGVEYAATEHPVSAQCFCFSQ